MTVSSLAAWLAATHVRVAQARPAAKLWLVERGRPRRSATLDFRGHGEVVAPAAKLRAQWLRRQIIRMLG